MAELFSVIIPIYKVEKYLDKCVESVLNQTYKYFEIILVDDGSPDKCGDMCDIWAERDERIKVIHQENKGLAGARNSGLSVAKGDYILFLDSDDFIEKELLMKTRAYMLKGYDICSFCARRVDEEYNYLYDIRYPEGVGDYSLDDFNRENFIFNILMQYKLGWEAWSQVYRHDFLTNNNLTFVEKLRFVEDLPFSIECMTKANKYIKLPDILYDYTLRNASLVDENGEIGGFEKVFTDVVKYLEDIVERYSNRKYDYSFYFAMLLRHYYNILVLKCGIDLDTFKRSLFATDSDAKRNLLKDVIEKRQQLIEIMGKTDAEAYLKVLTDLSS